ncbi:MAG: dephospho-CoA kinase [Candidatus Synoicihabitans palmerolidicus]|nr:dephospho-CoA kinase [Candidatus Synoicihabitans palmerolidicus]
MGCGKSTVAGLFVEAGYRLIDSDAMVRNELLPSEEMTQLMRDRWGGAIFGDDDKLDRKQLASRVFSDDGERELLESWVHPRLFARWREILATGPKDDWVVEVPLLFEKRLENWFDFIVCVASSADVQLARLRKRGISNALAGERISKQLPLARKLDLADMVLWNDGTLPFLREQVTHLQTELSADIERS